jgi:hypothetical protein
VPPPIAYDMVPFQMVCYQCKKFMKTNVEKELGCAGKCNIIIWLVPPFIVFLPLIGWLIIMLTLRDSNQYEFKHYCSQCNHHLGSRPVRVVMRAGHSRMHHSSFAHTRMGAHHTMGAHRIGGMHHTAHRSHGRRH